MSFYPEKISERFYALTRSGKAEKTNAVGTGASFLCGTFVRFFLEIDVLTKEIKDAKYKTNGCGFTIAAAEVLTGKIVGKKLTELHGLKNEELTAEIESELDLFPAGRKHCAEICLDALHAALNDFRSIADRRIYGRKSLDLHLFRRVGRRDRKRHRKKSDRIGRRSYEHLQRGRRLRFVRDADPGID